MSKHLLLPLVVILLGAGSLIAQSPQITSQPSNTTITLGSPVTFSATAAGGYRYQWQRDGTNTIPGATASSYTFTPTVADTGHIFNVIIWAANGTGTGSNSAWLHVTPRTDIPTITNTEDFGINTAIQAADSFGLGVDSSQPWEFAAVAHMGGKWVRADGCQWEKVEVQVMPANTSGGFAPWLAPDCLSEVTSAAQNGLHLDALSYFAPPSAQIATAVVASTTRVGSTVLPLQLLTGSLSGYDSRSLLIYGAGGLNTRIDYGAPVIGVSGTTLVLPEPSVATIPAGTRVQINVLLYPPVLVAPQFIPTDYVLDPSVYAWTNYIHAVQTFLQNEGVTGAVELWNEPEQSGELWDDAALYYSAPPANFSINNSGIALAYAASTLPLVPGVRLLNGWTDVSGNSSLYNTGNTGFIPVPLSQLNSAYLGESQHPYGNNPEQQSWIPAAVQADAVLGAQNPWVETPIGGQVGANFKSGVWFNDLPSALGGIGRAVTETGLQFGLTPAETEQQRTQFNLRQFLTMSGTHIYPIIFYKAATAPGWEWFGEDSGHTQHPVVAAFTGLLSDIHQIAQAPLVPYTSASMPQVTSYQGYYPLATVNLVGSRSGDSGNSILFFAWQKTYTVPPPASRQDENYGAAPAWISLSSPASVPLQVTVPTGSKVSFAKDLVTGSDLSYTQSGNVVTYPVTDDPTELLLIPAASKAASISVANVSATFGSYTVGVSATITHSAGAVPSGALWFTAAAEPKVAATCSVTGTTTEVCTATYPVYGWASGNYTIAAALVADNNYAAQTAGGTLTISQFTPVLTASNAAAVSSGSAVLLRASLAYTGPLAPTGGVTFRVGAAASIAANCAAGSSSILCTASYPLAAIPMGTSPITATLAADNNYRGVSGTATLTVTGSTVNILMGSASVAYGASSVKLTAAVIYTGASPASAISFQVAGGASVSAVCTGTASPLACSATYHSQPSTLGSYPVSATVSSAMQTTATVTPGTLTVTPGAATLSVSNETLASTVTSTTLYCNVIFTGSIAPSGVVDFSVDGGPITVAHYTGSVTSPRDAIASINLAGMSVGRHTVSCTLAADANYKAEAGTATLIINQAASK